MAARKRKILPSSPEAAMMLEVYQKRNKPRKSQRLGASQIGKECERQLWYGFRWAAEPVFKSETLRVFDIGHREEVEMVKLLNEAGLKVHDVDPENKDETGEPQQYTFTDCDGHLVCKVDGLMHRSATMVGSHVLEIKTSNVKGFKRIQGYGIAEAKPEHYAQVQVGMGLASRAKDAHFDNALYMVAVKDPSVKPEDELCFYTEIVPYVEQEFQSNRAKALRVIQSPTPPTGLGIAPEKFPCGWCDFKGTCLEGKVADVSCRTCAFSLPVSDGMWACEKHEKNITPAEQEAACGEHLFIPELIPFAEAIDSDEENGYVVYQMENGTRFLNMGETSFPPEIDMGYGYSSVELAATTSDLLGLGVIEDIRRHLGGRCVDVVRGPDWVG